MKTRFLGVEIVSLVVVFSALSLPAVSYADLSGTWDVYLGPSSGPPTDYVARFIIVQDATGDLSVIYGLGGSTTMNGYVSGTTVFMEFVQPNETITVDATTDGSTIIEGTFLCTGTSCNVTSGTIRMDLYSTDTTIPTLDIPVVTSPITIDGLTADWVSVPSFVDDDTGETAVSGADLEYVKAAVNPAKTRLYILMKSASGNINPADVVYAIQFQSTSSSPEPYDRQVYARFDSAWELHYQDNLTVESMDIGNKELAVSGQYVEFAIDLAALYLPDEFWMYGQTYPKVAGSSYDSAEPFYYVINPWSEGFSGAYCINDSFNMILSQTGNNVIFSIMVEDTIEGTGTVSGDTMDLSGTMPNGDTLSMDLLFTPDGENLDLDYVITDSSSTIVDQGSMPGTKGACPYVSPNIYLLAPYVTDSEITGIHEAYSVNQYAPWGFEHRGIDFFVDLGGSAEIQAVCDGTVNSIDLFENIPSGQTQGFWQVGVGITCNSRFEAIYAFEPMSMQQSDGQAQYQDITSYINVGDTVTQGQIIGELYYVEDGTHLHFGVNEYDQAVCPESYFDSTTISYILSLLDSEWGPGTQLCYDGTCPYTSNTLSISSPYVTASEISEIRGGFSVDSSAPWGAEHNGIDFFVDPGTSAQMQSVCYGTVDSIDLFENIPSGQTQGNWQVNVGITCSGQYETTHAFEPMSLLYTDGEDQYQNITSYINVGDAVSQGQIIGDLTYVEPATHLHFTVYECGHGVCPEPHFDTTTTSFIVSLLEATYGPGTQMCYE